MLADVNHRVGAVGLTQPEIERQVTVGRHQVRIVIDRARINLITARWLKPRRAEGQVSEKGLLNQLSMPWGIRAKLKRTTSNGANTF